MDYETFSVEYILVVYLLI